MEIFKTPRDRRLYDVILFFKCPKLESRMESSSFKLYFIRKIMAIEEIAHFIIPYPFHKMLCEKDLTKFNAKKIKMLTLLTNTSSC